MSNKIDVYYDLDIHSGAYSGCGPLSGCYLNFFRFKYVKRYGDLYYHVSDSLTDSIKSVKQLKEKLDMLEDTLVQVIFYDYSFGGTVIKCVQKSNMDLYFISFRDDFASLQEYQRMYSKRLIESRRLILIMFHCSVILNIMLLIHLNK